MQEMVYSADLRSDHQGGRSGRAALFRLSLHFVRLVARGALLELFTLGFYRFWLNTDMRRHLWSHTSVGGDAIEYTGTPKELLIGFLFALAVLVPVYLVYFLVGIESERMQAFASIPLVLFFFVFAQFAVYRARRYRLTRTIWRGVRFWMTGSGWVYALQASLWGLLVVVTLGLALPWYQAALERYKMRHTYYGDLQGSFVGTGWDFFKRGWWLWFSAMLTIVLFVAAVSGAVSRVSSPSHMAVMAGVAGVLVVLATIAWPFAYAVFKAIEWRWWASGIRFGEVRFESRLRTGAFIGLYWSVIGWGALLMVCLSVWIGTVIRIAFDVAGSTSFQPDELQTVMQNPSILIAALVGYVVAALALNAIMRVYLRHDNWARIVSSTHVFNLAAADNVAARGQTGGIARRGPCRRSRRRWVLAYDVPFRRNRCRAGPAGAGGLFRRDNKPPAHGCARIRHGSRPGRGRHRDRELAL